MRQNSFQKNVFLNINNTNNTYDNGNLGRRSIQEIKDDMYAAKTKKVDINKNNGEDLNYIKPLNNHVNHQQRVEQMKNFNRWK